MLLLMLKVGQRMLPLHVQAGFCDGGRSCNVGCAAMRCP